MLALGLTSMPDSLKSSTAWTQYAATPSPSSLKVLLSVADGEDPRPLLEGEFVATRNWRIAQHLALLYLGAFPAFRRSDLVLALYYAVRACEFSCNDPRALLVRARVNWGRRIPFAVTYDVDLAEAALQQETPASSEDLVRHQCAVGECHLLRGMAFSYVRDSRALKELRQAERLKVLTPEATVQLLLACDLDQGDEALWAAPRLLHEHLGPGPRARLLRTYRRILLEMLRTKVRGASSAQ